MRQTRPAILAGYYQVQTGPQMPLKKFCQTWKIDKLACRYFNVRQETIKTTVWSDPTDVR